MGPPLFSGGNLTPPDWEVVILDGFNGAAAFQRRK